jgi:Predicted nucleotidyltransferases
MAEKDFYKTLGISETELKSLAERYHVQKVAVFGSFARGEQTKDSDIDLLVTWKKTPNLNRFMGFIEDIEQKTGRHVDIATPDSLHWYLKEKILSDARGIYEGS